jgi:hypothetical protein
MLTVVGTCRQQGRIVLDDLTSCFEAARKRHAIPSLLPVPKPAIKAASFQSDRSKNRYLIETPTT